MYHCQRREGSSAPTSTGLSVHREVPLSEKRGQLSSHLHWSLGPQRYVPLSEKRGQLSSHLHQSVGPQRGTTVGEERTAQLPPPPVSRSTERYHCRRREGSSAPTSTGLSVHREVPLSEKRGQLSSHLYWSLGPQRGTTVGEERAAQLPPPLVSRSTERYHCRRREGSSAPTSTGLSVHREVPLSEKRGQLLGHGQVCLVGQLLQARRESHCVYVGEGTGGGGAYVVGGWVGERGIMSNKDAVK